MAEAEGKGFHEEDCASSILDKKRLNNGKLGTAQPHPPKQPRLQCPECSSKKIWKDGLRYLKDGSTIQRWLCRDCGFRFSQSTANNQVKVNVSVKVLKEPNPGKNLLQANVFQSDFPLKPTSEDSPFKSCEHIASHTSSKQTIAEKVLNTFADYNRERQVCAALTRGAKNLAKSETRQEKAAGATKTDQKTTKGLIAQFTYWLDKEGYKSSGYLQRICRLARLGTNLFDPEDVKKVIAAQSWKDSVKLYTVYAYDAMTKMLGITWTPPKYKPKDTLPFVPEEGELDQLIATCRSRRMAAYLQTLKETFADPGEALRLRWIDKNDKARIITINHPVKGHNPRQLEVSSKLIAMLNALPKKSKLIFPTTYQSMRTCFGLVRKRASQTLQNPRLLEISFRTFRHWGGTMIAHYTHGNVLTVQRLLGHKRIESTMKYIHMVHFKDDEFDVATATTVEEIKQLATAGFEKIDEIKGVHVFRRPKRFACYT